MTHRPARLFLLALAILALPVFAQEPTAAPPVDQVSATTPLGYLLMGFVTLGGLALTAMLSSIGYASAMKAKDGAAWSLANRLWVAMQQAVTHAEAEIRPHLQKALEDGKLSPEEKADLKARALAVFKTIAGDLLTKAPKVLGYSPAGMPHFLSGLLERAVGAMKASPAVTKEIGKIVRGKVPTPTVKESSAAVAAARANPPAEAAPTAPEAPALDLAPAPTPPLAGAPALFDEDPRE